MGGGLNQLVIRGQHDMHFIKNPDMSYFKYSYNKHTNFALESLELDFDGTAVPRLEELNKEYICKIKRDGDLLKKLYFCCTLPKIYSTSNLAFKWIENIGNILLKKSTIKINGLIIDKITSEWLNIWNELTIDDEGYDKMIGNIEKLNNPSLTRQKKIIISNNKFIYDYYPNSSKNNLDNPSIDEYKLVIPIPFWFTKNPNLALPLIKLQSSEIQIGIELEDPEKLYTVYSKELEENISPLFYNELYSKDLTSGIKERNNIDINTFTVTKNLKAYIEAVYVFLDTDEIRKIQLKNQLSYLVENIEYTTQSIVRSNKESKNEINITTTKPIKEIIWTTKREDYISKFNNHTNFTGSIRKNDDYGILDRASIIADKTKILVDNKKDIFYNKIQSYQHHSNILKNNGIYLYSFSLNPENNNPSGYLNGGYVDIKLEYYLKKFSLNDPEYNLNIKMRKYNKFTELELDTNIKNYYINIYCLSYNIFYIDGGIGSLRFI
tara:strand:+ start:41 stop:1522 length:1482 start_codon:yes stop_codon:yes gene_type:complete